ncbi:MAG: DUF4405 domain-containing protein [Planctomyces sp.]
MTKSVGDQEVATPFNGTSANREPSGDRAVSHMSAQSESHYGTVSMSSVRTSDDIRELLSAFKKNGNAGSRLPLGNTANGSMHQEISELTHEEPGGSPRRISMTFVNFWLDAALLVAFVGLGIASVIVQFVFPPGIAARGWRLWGMTFGEWSSIQFGLLSVLAVGILVHIMFHWTWICGVVFKRLLKRGELPDDGIRTVIGVGFLIAILLTSSAVIGVATMSIQQPELHQAD